VVSTTASVAMPTISGSPGNNSGLSLRWLVHLILRCGSRLKPSFSRGSTASGRQFRQPRLAGAAQAKHRAHRVGNGGASWR
jgi:hypothetical protein